MRPIGPLRRTDHYVAFLSAYVADAASLQSPPPTAVKCSSAASPSLPDDLNDDGSYLLRFLGTESLPDSSWEGQVTDDNAETNQKPMSHHKDSDGHQEQFVSEDGLEIHNVNIQLQNDPFENPNDSSNHVKYPIVIPVLLRSIKLIARVAPIKYNSWSTEDWNIVKRFNDKYMQMPPEVAFGVGPRPLPPFYDDSDQSLGIESPPSSSEVQVDDDNAETSTGSSTINQKPVSHKDSDGGHQEQFVADDHDKQETRFGSGSEIHNINVQLQNDSFKNPNGSSNQSEVALPPIHCNSWSTEDWNTPPPPFYSDADQYLLPSLSPTYGGHVTGRDGFYLNHLHRRM